MNKSRREFLQAGAVAAIAAGPLAVMAYASPPPAKKYGRLTVESHLYHKRLTGESLHVYIEGEDVTLNCYEADDVEGYVKVFCRDAEHHKALDAKGALHVADHWHGPCQMMVRGSVVIAPGADL